MFLLALPLWQSWDSTSFFDATNGQGFCLLCPYNRLRQHFILQCPICYKIQGRCNSPQCILRCPICSPFVTRLKDDVIHLQWPHSFQDLRATPFTFSVAPFITRFKADTIHLMKESQNSLFKSISNWPYTECLSDFDLLHSDPLPHQTLLEWPLPPSA